MRVMYEHAPWFSDLGGSCPGRAKPAATAGSEKKKTKYEIRVSPLLLGLERLSEVALLSLVDVDETVDPPSSATTFFVIPDSRLDGREDARSVPPCAHPGSPPACLRWIVQPPRDGHFVVVAPYWRVGRNSAELLVVDQLGDTSAPFRYTCNRRPSGSYFLK